VFATLILLIEVRDGKHCERITMMTVRMILQTMVTSLDSGLHSVAMLGRMGVRRLECSRLDKYTSVRMYWLTKFGVTRAGSVEERSNQTPVSMPSPSNQWASRPRSELVAGFPPFLTYMPPSSSVGTSPVHVTGVGDHVFVTGAKLPARYL
jgi:hypothetical protein